MAEYRVYVLGTDGHFIRSIEFLCPDDDRAKQCAKKLVVGQDIELWQGERRIERLSNAK